MERGCPASGRLRRLWAQVRRWAHIQAQHVQTLRRTEVASVAHARMLLQRCSGEIVRAVLVKHGAPAAAPPAFPPCPPIPPRYLRAHRPHVAL